jgi:Neurotransmitter-gated ion-channel ligand binding domain/Neurotransmitter-gated ion-channel transmembrane region
MKYIWLKCFYWLSNQKISDRKIRQKSLRWWWSLLAGGLAAWIVSFSGSIGVAETPHPGAKIPAAEIITAQASAVAQPKSAEKNDTENLKSYPIESKPVKVSIGLHMSNLANIDQATESFDIGGYLMYTWRDPRLAYQSKSNGLDVKDSSLDQIWHPALEMVNAKASVLSDTIVEILPDGTVLAQERFIRTLSSALELQKFPFDRQSFDVVIESLRYGKSMVELVVDPTKISIGKDKFVSLSEWNLGKIIGTSDKSFFPPEKQDYGRVTIAIQADRAPGFYISKVIIPLLLITMASWSVFWIKPQEFSTQISVAFTNLLTIVALLLVINDKLPRVGYLTLMDGFTAICFLSILIVILELLITHRLVSIDNHDKAENIHRFAQWVMPIGFVGSNLILLLGMGLLTSQ